jgi:drug/metabolite transporter (DMT)-like permease
MVILWILIAGLGAIMTSWDENINARQLFSFKNKAFWIFFIAAFLYALGNVAVKPALKIVTNFNFLIWREFAWFGVLLALMPLIFHKRERKRLREDWKDAIGFVILGILIQFFGYILMFYALGISVQITMGLSASNGFFAVIIGFFLSKTSLGILLEKHGSRIYIIRMIGALMILFSIYKLSFVL